MVRRHVWGGFPAPSPQAAAGFVPTSWRISRRGIRFPHLPSPRSPVCRIIEGLEAPD